LTQLTF